MFVFPNFNDTPPGILLPGRGKNLEGTINLSESDGSSLNLGNLSNQRCIEENEPQVVFAAVMVALVVIGLVGNSLVFFTIMVLREYRKSVTNWYILQLTIADTLFLFMLPFTAHSEITGYWDFGIGLCKVKEAIIFINYYASIYFLVVMSFDRYLAVTKAFASNQWVTSLRSPNASYIISILGWVLSVILCIQIYRYSDISDCKICQYTFPIDSTPVGTKFSKDCLQAENKEKCFKEFGPPGLNKETGWLSGSGLENPSNDSQYIDYPAVNPFEQTLIDRLVDKYAFFNMNSSDDNDTGINLDDIDIPKCRLPQSRELHIWVYGNFVGAFVLPFVFICFFYGMIMITIRRASVIGDNVRQRSYRRRVTMIVLALVTLFAISWLPWYVDKLIKIPGIYLKSEQCVTLRNAVRGIAYLNSAFNPYFYSFLGVHFRERLKRASRSVRLPSSFRTRPSVVTSLRRRKYSTSNSQGSNRNNQNMPPQSSVENKNVNSKVEDVKGQSTATAAKTERTVV